MRKTIGVGIFICLLPWIITLFWTGDLTGAFGEVDTVESVEHEILEEPDGNVQEWEGQTGEDVGQEAAAELTQEEVSIEKLRILVEREGIKTHIFLEDYLPGVIIYQIPMEYELEALKAQAVIARTYIHRLMDGRTEIWEDELDLDYLSENQKNIPWDREKTAENLARCKQAVEETKGVVMQYEERDILPLFHGGNGGRTRTGEVDYPYLQGVESKWDVEATESLQIYEWGLAEFAEKINSIPDAQPVSAEDLPAQIQTVKKDDSGYMVEMKIGAKTYKGEEIQYALDLPSPCFSIEGNSERIRGFVKGKGHGYGMSQAGANGMAGSGWGYEEILKYYYKNISLISE